MVFPPYEPRKLPKPDPTRFLDRTLRQTFHATVRSGDISAIQEMLNQEPLLSQARTSNRETPLLLAAVHQDTRKAVEMIDLLMNNGAILGSRDLRKRNVLLYACHCGVEWEVVECVMKWNTMKGEGILKWSHCDEDVHSSLILAILGGHTQLALRLLDEIDLQRYSAQNHRFHVLQAAIKSKNEPHALAIAAHVKIRDAILAGKSEGFDRSGDPLRPYTIVKCTEDAVRQGMADVVSLMDTLNHPKVSKTVWYHIYHSSETTAEATNPAILAIGDQYAKDWRWDKIKMVFLIRYRGMDSDVGNPSLRSHLLVRLPDQLFRLVVEFIQHKEVCKTDAREGEPEGALENLLKMVMNAVSAMQH
ncbi:hypothetical protein PHMEG_00030069 [Phytophthora megakarya]|uniref:Uncharacterized protein n=1 Tax=Phytophthora megakarya TaxID=4795 RepID=A0A225V121_9STRA|nr:hypothetical protein PHMEG_00030069 [Phytophthora megakarya]